MRTKKKYFMPQWALTKIENLAKFYETTKTQALLMMISKGSNYYEKEMRKAGFIIDNTTEKPAETHSGNGAGLLEEIITPEDKARLDTTIAIAKAKWVEEN